MKKFYSLVAVAMLAIGVSAQNNLIINGGFETWEEGKPANWYVPNNATITQSTNSHGGEFAVSYTTPASGNSTISPLVDIPVEANKTYVFSGWYLDNSSSARFRYWNQFRTAPGSDGSDTGSNNMQMEDYSTDSPEWVFFSAEAQPNAGATVARPGLRVYPENGNGGGVILLDDIMFYDKASMAVVDASEFTKSVKMNTVVTDKLTLQLAERSTVNIYTIDGKLVSSDRVNNGGSINTQNLAKGIYLVTVSNGKTTVSQKIVKK